MTQLTRCLFATFFLLGGLLGYGQLRPEAFQPGVLYLKIKNESNLVLPTVDEILDREYPAEWVSLVESYGITELTRSLRSLKTPVFDRVYRLRFDAWEKKEDLIEKISTLPYVEYAELLPFYQASLIPNDSLWSQQSNALELIGAPDAWDLHTGGNTVVAVIDNAIELDHPDLSPNLWTNTGEIPNNGIDDDNNGYIDDIHGWDAANEDGNTTPPADNGNPLYTTFTHGTHVSGLAAAATDNDIGIASIGHSTKIMAVKVTFDNAFLPLAIQTPLEGVAYAISNDADVINMSFGGPGAFGSILDSLMREALRRNIILVAAAGNDGSMDESFPAALDGVLAVVMTDDVDLVNPLSNFGSWVDICAPGTQRLSSTSFGSYERQTGTSMASPTVAGLLALMKSYQPGFPKEVYEYVMLQT
ncbi:MAG: S8 family serine peptidase, partial [Bacteroidota bacterium]